MKQFKSAAIFVAFLCAFLAGQANGLPQLGHRWPQSRFNTSTVYGNRWQPKVPAVIVANYSAPQQQWQRWNGTQPSVGRIYQPEGERLWQNNNQSHPYIQVPGFRNRRSYATAMRPEGQRLWQNNNQTHPYIQVPGSRQNFSTARQPNQNISSGTGWKVPQSNGNYASVRNNSTPNNSWSGSSLPAATWNIGRPIYNSTTGGYNVRPNWQSPGSVPPSNSGWVAPLSPANNATWVGGAANSNGKGIANPNPIWNSRLPGSTQVTGNGPIGANSGVPLAPLGGGASWNSNPSQAGLSYSNGQQQSHGRPTYSSNNYRNLFH